MAYTIHRSTSCNVRCLGATGSAALFHQGIRIYLFWLLICSAGCGMPDGGQTRFTYQDDGVMVIDGKRTFIIGCYHLPKSDDPFGTLTANGYNYVRVVDRSQLDMARENGLYGWMHTGSIPANHFEKDKDRISNLINDCKDHPALLFWEIEDEPAFTWNSAEHRISPERMARTYDFIKSIDADHLIITNHAPANLVSTLRKYNRSTDLVACDVYPVIPRGIMPTYALHPDGLQGDLLNPTISQVGEYVDKMKEVVRGSGPVFMVLQGFSWEMLKEERERDASMILYPTYEESRFMAYNAIIHGATGILYWGTSYTPQPGSFMDDLNRVTRELAMLQEVLAARTTALGLEIIYHELGYSVEAGIELLAKEHEGKVFLITANADKNPVLATLSGLDGHREAIVLNENRTVAIGSGKITEHYKPFDVHIYALQ